MDCKAFKRLYDGDRIIFTMAMELLLENGRNCIMEHSEEELNQAIEKQLSAFFVPEKVSEVVQAAKAFSQLKLVDLLTYIKECDIQVENRDVDVSGVCPVCGGPLLYGEDTAANSGAPIGWLCQDCGATGREVYREKFDHHADVRLGDGRPVPPRES